MTPAVSTGRREEKRPWGRKRGLLKMLPERPTAVHVDLDALRHNYHLLRRRAGMPVMPVIKANAYGHGAVAAGRTLAAAGADFFAVATAAEAREIIAAGVDGRFLVLGGVYEHDLPLLAGGKIVPVLWQVEDVARLDAWAREQKLRLAVHVKIDTGMRRAGALPAAAPAVVQAVHEAENLLLEGLMTHLAVADSPAADDREFTAGQRQCFSRLLADLASRGIRPRYCHLDNSAGSVLGGPGPANLCRPGIMLYGSYPDPMFLDQVDLRPVMTVKTAVVMLKKLRPGESISYGRTYTAARETLVGLLPIGYADGLRRLLSNRGFMLLLGRRVPIIGRVCMDWTMIDVSGVPGAAVGDEVVVLGRQGEESISAEEMAAWLQTISYEVFCLWGPRVPRRYHGG